MIKVVTSEERHTSDRGWIHSEFSFSFADYDDPSNAHFGCLLAHNDNTLMPQEGFKRHPHHDLEIVSYVISGRLKHTDSMGTEQILEPGTVQVMSAGTGVEHSETNPSEDEPVRFLQMWFLPSQRMLKPSYTNRQFDPQEQLNRLCPVVSGQGVEGAEGALPIAQDVTCYLTQLESGKKIMYPQHEDRRTHLFLISGHVDITCADGNFNLKPGDAARIRKSCDLQITSTGSEVAEFVLVDLP
ncbi:MULTISPECIES: pirin family protein [Paenibacillus]|uniref:pirin family protein n=1 Tax=Paenibacillus TaxID=44249 RepID=UPI00129D401A|nr:MULTISPECIES: pirin family protein [Paenibacillus]MBE7683038.1 cupin domain-containing protein [Paenibacillus sp. P13VS]MCM3207607.1 pirin family protein [Paenibacillus illinoisensis]